MSALLLLAREPTLISVTSPSLGNFHLAYPGCQNSVQIVNIVTLGSGTGSGGFFPNGLVGVINGTAGSVAAPSNLPPALTAAAPALAPSSVPLVSAPAPSSGDLGACLALHHPALGTFPQSVRLG